ncbi:MAG: ribonuclease E/G, partial [Methylococcaceae bacterium]|nr:ribonuclease E/G [Methylococcaceae bacterium]
TEKVIAHLPIDCATFLLNEKRNNIDQIENRLKVDIIILPSKHLETPAYDIERIKEKDALEEKSSYQQIKTEEIALPEFAQQSRQRTEKAAIKEFLPDSPAPMQNRSEAASLIKRFWHKLVGLPKQPDEVPAKEQPARTAERHKPAGPRPERNKKRQGKDQAAKPEARPPRPPRDHQKPAERQSELPAPILEPSDQLAEAAVLALETETQLTEAPGVNVEQNKSFNGKSNRRRGPRRRQRQSNRNKSADANYAPTESGTDSGGRLETTPYADDIIESRGSDERHESESKPERRHLPEAESAPVIVESAHYESGSDS